MTKPVLYILTLSSLLLVASCQSVEQLSIDYLLPADVSFPQQLKKVAIVNNVPADDSEPSVTKTETESDYIETATFSGNPAITAEALAQALAEGNYFDEVVICDSALQATGSTAKQMLETEEANQLINDLQVDFLIALEDIKIKTRRKISYVPGWNVYHGTVDANVYPSISVYLPNRKGPMVSINNNDSIFWEEFDNSGQRVMARLISQEEVIRQASDFGGSIPVKHLLPHWKTATRYLFTGGSVNMRDAAIYAKESNWPEAIKLWEQAYDSKKGKQKMYAACNIALGYEMQDSIATATEWAKKAQEQARKIDKIDQQNSQSVTPASVPNFVFTSLYVEELQDRKNSQMKLSVQMQRLGDDF